MWFTDTPSSNPPRTELADVTRDNDDDVALPNGTTTAADLPEAGSMVALLMNVQGLLRMAVEAAKHKEQKIRTDKGKLKIL